MFRTLLLTCWTIASKKVSAAYFFHEWNIHRFKYFNFCFLDPRNRITWDELLAHPFWAGAFLPSLISLSKFFLPLSSCVLLSHLPISASFFFNPLSLPLCSWCRFWTHRIPHYPLRARVGKGLEGNGEHKYSKKKGQRLSNFFFCSIISFIFF